MAIEIIWGLNGLMEAIAPLELSGFTMKRLIPVFKYL